MVGQKKAVVIAPYIAEFIGTFFLTLAVGCNTLNGSIVWGATANACVLMVLIYAFGDVSGGHFNPAVSIALFISDVNNKLKFTLYQLIIYIVTQLLGSALGAATYCALFYQGFNIAPAAGFQWYEAALAESVYTCMLCFVVLSCALATREEAASQFAPLAIGFVLVAGAHGAGAISGGCFNPAIALAVDVSSADLGFGWSVAYIGFQLVGAAVAAVLYRFTRPAEFGSMDRLLKKSHVTDDQVRISHAVSEFLGTFMLTVTVGLNVLSDSTAGAWSVGASLMCMIYALADRSGAHFNPAVTLATTVGTSSHMFPRCTFFWLSQFLAGIVGSWTFAMMYGWETFALVPSQNFPLAARCLAEVFFTFVLCLTVLVVACSKKDSQDVYFGMAIGFAIVAGGFSVAGISGGTMNPAVTLGVATTRVFCKTCTLHESLMSLAKIALEFAGGYLAALAYRFFLPSMPISKSLVDYG